MISSFPTTQPTGKIFLVGHVLTSVDKQELLYKVNNLPFIKIVDDNVVVDEFVWENTNALVNDQSELGRGLRLLCQFLENLS